MSIRPYDKCFPASLNSRPYDNGFPASLSIRPYDKGFPASFSSSPYDKGFPASFSSSLINGTNYIYIIAKKKKKIFANIYQHVRFHSEISIRHVLFDTCVIL